MTQNEDLSNHSFTADELFSARIANMSDSFSWSIDALLEVTEVSIPEVAKLDSNEAVSSTISKLMSSLSGDSAKRLHEVFERHEATQTENPEESLHIMEMIWDAVKTEEWGSALMTHLHEAMQRPPRLPMFLRSTTVSAVSHFEVLLSGLATEYYGMTPQALEATSREKEKEFSLKELKQMDSISDAVDIAIERRVDELMFGSFGEWRKFFNDKMNLKFEDYAIDWTLLQEVFQRRHVIVHNGGRASRRYLRNVDPKFTADVQEGDTLHVDQEYVVRAAHELLHFGFLLATAVGLKLAKGNKEYFLSHLHKFTYRNLVKGRYEVVKRCSSFGQSISERMDDELTFRVNAWIARQRLADPLVHSEVSAWDARALSSRYILAKHCLLGEDELAIDLLKSLYSAGGISFEDIIEWPMLDNLRGTEPYLAMTRRMEIPEGWRFADAIFYENPKTGTLHLRSCPLSRPDFRRRALDQIDPASAVFCKRCNTQHEDTPPPSSVETIQKA